MPVLVLHRRANRMSESYLPLARVASGAEVLRLVGYWGMRITGDCGVIAPNAGHRLGPLRLVIFVFVSGIGIVTHSAVAACPVARASVAACGAVSSEAI